MENCMRRKGQALSNCLKAEPSENLEEKYTYCQMEASNYKV
jgi:hypothetical protein